MVDRETLDRARRQTLDVYARQAAGWDRHRPRTLFERGWLLRWLACMPTRPRVLDLGCGAGAPITGFLVERSVEYIGVDASLPMLELARSRWPQATFLHRDMRDLAGLQGFDGVLSWDGSFHLTAAEQAALINALATCTTARGAALLTIGHEAGEVIGHVEGEAVYHASLSPEEYRRRFQAAGFSRVELGLNDPACGEHSLCLAVR